MPDNEKQMPPFAERWGGYYAAVTGSPPRDTLLFALERFGDAFTENAEPFAIDLGCGEGRDTAELLRRGWRVLAVDSQDEAIQRLRTRPDVPPEAFGRLETLVAPMEAAPLPNAAALVVNASFALPFCPPDAFPALWERITGALVPGQGRFCGQLFGVRDEWAAAAPRLTFHTRADVETLLRWFDVEFLDEVERDGMTVEKTPKHWHVFHIVARRKTNGEG